MLLLLLSSYPHLHLQLSLAPLWIDWLPWQLVGHVPLNWSKVLSKLIQFTNHHVRVKVTGKRVNCGFGLGLEIQVNYFLWRDKSYNMAESSLEKLDNELHVKVKKCVKQKNPCVFYFPNQS